MRFATLSVLVIISVAAALSVTGAASAKTKRLSADDYAEIHQLYAAYSKALDMGDGPARAATFTPDGVFLSALSNHTPDSMAVVVKRTNERGNSGTRHWISNISITPTDAGADGFCYLIVLAAAKPGDTTLRGRPEFYVDKLVRTKAGWRFKSRETWADEEPNSPFRPKPGAGGVR